MASDQKIQKIYMVTGKGGVGKSVVAAALARENAQAGFRTLLVELGDTSSYQYVFHDSIKKSIGYEPSLVEKNLYVALWSGETCLKEYVEHLVKIRPLVDLFFDNKVMRTFVRAAPALKELAILGKVTSGVRNWGPPLPFDRIVVDGFATGHFMALLKAPIGIAELISTGPMGEQSKAMQKVLSDPQFAEYLVVTLLEELPVSETFELQNELKKWVGQEARVVANKYFNSKISQSEYAELAPQVSEKPLSRWFLSYLKNLDERSASAKTRLEQLPKRYVELPLVLSTSTLKVIHQLSREVQFL